MSDNTYQCDLWEVDPITFLRTRALPPRLIVRLHTRRLHDICQTDPKARQYTHRVETPLYWLTLWESTAAQNVGHSLQRLKQSEYGLTKGRWMMDHLQPVDPMTLTLEDGEPDATDNIWKLVEAHIAEVILPELAQCELDTHSTTLRWSQSGGESSLTPFNLFS